MSTTATATATTATAFPTATLNLKPSSPPPTSTLEWVPLHNTFGAECRGIDFTSLPLPQSTIDEIQAGIAKYGVVVFRNTGLSDPDFVTLGERFGEMADQGQSRRFPTPKLGDPSNLYLDGSIVKPGELRWFLAKETALFHVDTVSPLVGNGADAQAYDPRRVRLTGLIAHQLPPKGTGGATEFGDTRTAYADLDDETKALLQGKVGVHSHFHSRRVALPNFPTFAALDPNDYPMSKHHIVQTHRGSGRPVMYIASHLHHIDGMPEPQSSELILKLRKKVEEDKYVLKVYYDQPGDMVIWDNTATVHRAGGNEGEGWAGKYVRDIRKWMVYDNSPEEWGLNSKDTPKFYAGPIIQAKHDEIYGESVKVWDFDED